MSENDSLDFEKLKKGDDSILAKIYERYRNEFILWLVKKYNCTDIDALEVYQNSILVLAENARNNAKTVLKGTIKQYLFFLGKNKYNELKRYQDRKDNYPIDFQNVDNSSLMDALLSHTDNFSFVFDINYFKPNEIADFLSLVSDLYYAKNGKRLKIKDSFLMEESKVKHPVTV